MIRRSHIILFLLKNILIHKSLDKRINYAKQRYIIPKVLYL
jgi:hypothetical protein